VEAGQVHQEQQRQQPTKNLLQDLATPSRPLTGLRMAFTLMAHMPTRPHM